MTIAYSRDNQDDYLHRPGPAELRRVFGAFPTGVTSVAALAEGRPVGLSANSFTSVSLDPAIVLVCIAATSRSWPRLRLAPRLGISVLGAHQEHVSRQLAATATDRFARLSWRATADGAVLIDGASAWLDCSVYDEVAAGVIPIYFVGMIGIGAGGA